MKRKFAKKRRSVEYTLFKSDDRHLCVFYEENKLDLEYFFRVASSIQFYDSQPVADISGFHKNLAISMSAKGGEIIEISKSGLTRHDNNAESKTEGSKLFIVSAQELGTSKILGFCGVEDNVLKQIPPLLKLTDPITQTIILSGPVPENNEVVLFHNEFGFESFEDYLAGEEDRYNISKTCTVYDNNNDTVVALFSAKEWFTGKKSETITDKHNFFLSCGDSFDNGESIYFCAGGLRMVTEKLKHPRYSIFTSRFSDFLLIGFCGLADTSETISARIKMPLKEVSLTHIRERPPQSFINNLFTFQKGKLTDYFPVA